jgi:hypothetical protein
MKVNFIYFKALMALLIISLPFLGSNCNNSTTQVTNENIQGNWQLVSSTGGNLHDICPGETVDFQSNGIAVLTCPQQFPINRNYSVSNNVLTFTETGVKYTVSMTNNNTILDMTGQGNVAGRILEYNKISAFSDIKNITPGNSSNKNSSEK